MSSLALISTTPLCLLLVTTSVAGLPTENPTPDLIGRSLPLETRSWNYESTCQPRKGQCQVGTYTTQDTVTQNNTATLSLFDQTCKKIGNKDQAPRQTNFAFDSQLPFVVIVQFDQEDDWSNIPSLWYTGKHYPSTAYRADRGWYGPDGKRDQYFSLIWFDC
jgi:hypothetical protein